MRFVGLAILSSFAALIGAIVPVSAETREDYLARLRQICEVECLEPRQLLNAARKRGSGDEVDIAGIFDIRFVSRDGDKFRLHTQAPRQADFWDLQQLSFGMPEFDGRTVTNANDIVIEMDEATLADLLRQPVSGVNAVPGATGNGDIVVEGDRDIRLDKPTLLALSALLNDRRIAVRGKPRLVPALVGARRDFRKKKLSIVLDNADDLAMLPRYDKVGNPLPEDLPWLNGPAQAIEN